MLARNARLKSPRDFTRLYRRGQSAKSGLFRISWLKSGLDHPRIAIVVSTKVSKRAVKRNRLKRQLRAIALVLVPKLKSIDLVIRVLPITKIPSYQDLSAQLAKFLEKQSLLR